MSRSRQQPKAVLADTGTMVETIVVAMIRRIDVPVPAAESGAMGALRSAVLEAHLLDQPAEIPTGCADAVQAWCEDVLGDVEGEAQGLRTVGVPESWRSTLSWAGVPFAATGALQWGRDLSEDATLEHPCIIGDHLHLPPEEALAECTGLGIKPLRLWVQQRTGVRLQAAPGLRLYVWPSHGLVISHLDIPVGGFLYGPGVGTRMGLTIHPGAWQLVPW